MNKNNILTIVQKMYYERDNLANIQNFKNHLKSKMELFTNIIKSICIIFVLIPKLFLLETLKLHQSFIIRTFIFKDSTKVDCKIIIYNFNFAQNRKTIIYN